MAIQVDFRFLLLVRLLWFVCCVLGNFLRAMNYGSNEGKVGGGLEQTESGWRVKIKVWQTKWNRIFIIYSVFTQPKLTPTAEHRYHCRHRRRRHHHHHFNPGKWREAKQQQSNQIQTLGQSIGSEVYAQHRIRCTHSVHTLASTSTNIQLANASSMPLIITLNVYCILYGLHTPWYLLSIWHITPMWCDVLYECVCVCSFVFIALL